MLPWHLFFMQPMKFLSLFVKRLSLMPMSSLWSIIVTGYIIRCHQQSINESFREQCLREIFNFDKTELVEELYRAEGLRLKLRDIHRFVE